jgi:hypothetical protein
VGGREKSNFGNFEALKSPIKWVINIDLLQIASKMLQKYYIFTFNVFIFLNDLITVSYTIKFVFILFREPYGKCSKKFYLHKAFQSKNYYLATNHYLLYFYFFPKSLVKNSPEKSLLK